MANKKTEKTLHSDYNLDNYQIKDYIKEIYKKENEWKRELRERLKKDMSHTYGHLPGSVLTKNSWVNQPTITTTNSGSSAITINGDRNNASVKIDAPLFVNGRDIMKELNEMRDVLLLLRRDVDMEAKYPRLKELKDEYERELEKYKTFEALK